MTFHKQVRLLELGLSVVLGLAVLPRHSHAQCGVNASALGLKPLTEIGAGSYQGQEGGLYRGGSNQPPPAHLAAATQLAAARVTPIRGKLVLISVGMSNTTQQFSDFVPKARGDSRLNPALVVVDGAQGGQAADAWIAPQATTWDNVDTRLRAAGVEPDQVRVAWIKQAEKGPAMYGAFPAHATYLQGHLETIARNLRLRYPNIVLAFVSSRTHAFIAASTTLNPEPFAFESGYSVKWMIDRQISGASDLNYDDTRGPVMAPLLLWGPYLWAEGTRGDLFSWEMADVAIDCTHPSPTGRGKVGNLLLDFFTTHPAATPWFVAGNQVPDAATPVVDGGGSTDGETQSASTGCAFAARTKAGGAVCLPGLLLLMLCGWRRRSHQAVKEQSGLVILGLT